MYGEQMDFSTVFEEVRKELLAGGEPSELLMACVEASTLITEGKLKGKDITPETRKVAQEANLGIDKPPSQSKPEEPSAAMAG